MLNIPIIAATLITLLQFVLTVGVKQPTGPDKAGIAILWVFLEVPRWFCLAIVLWSLTRRDGFAWISASRDVQTFVVMAAHVLMGFVVLTAVVAANDSSSPLAFHIGTYLVGFGIPVAILLYCAATVNPSLEAALPMHVLQWILTGSTAISLVVAVVVVGIAMKDSFDREEAKAKERALENDAYYKQRLAELEALPKDGPMGPFLHYIHNEPGDIRQRASKAVQERPTFLADMAALLRNEWRQEAIVYMLAEMPNPPDELAPAAADAVKSLAADTVQQSTRGATYDDEFGYECRLSVQVADRFPKHAQLFAGPLKELLAGMKASPDKRVASAGRYEIEHWLKRYEKNAGRS